MTSQAVVAEKTARFILDRFVGLQSSDEVLLIADPTADEQVVATFRRALEEIATSCVALSMPDTVDTGDELPRSIDTALAAADVVVLVSRWFPAWVATSGFSRAIQECGTRVLQIDPPHQLVMEAGVNDADLAAIVEYGLAARRRVQNAGGLLIVDRFGNELRCAIDASDIYVASEFPLRFGFTKAPAGVFTVGVVPGTYEGTIAWDAVEGRAMEDGDIIEARVERGVVVEVGGGGNGMEYVAHQVSTFSEFAQLTEFGLGTNPSIPEREFLEQPWHEGANRSAGIVHFGLGSHRNAAAGAGPAGFHTHLVSRGASVYTLDNMQPIVLSGRLAVGPTARR